MNWLLPAPNEAAMYAAEFPFSSRDDFTCADRPLEGVGYARGDGVPLEQQLGVVGRLREVHHVVAVLHDFGKLQDVSEVAHSMVSSFSAFFLRGPRRVFSAGRQSRRSSTVRPRLRASAWT